MNADIVNPCLNSIINVLQTMASMSCVAGKVELKKDILARGEVTGVIGMNDLKHRGSASIAISFSKEAILAITKRMIGEDVTAIDATVRDMVGELTNMMTGNTKSQLDGCGFEFDMEIPSVVAGRSHVVPHGIIGPTLIVPFKSEVGDFYVEVCFLRIH